MKTEISGFKAWLQKATNDRLIFKTYEEYCIVCDGYMAFKINFKLKEYLDVIKQYTFQDLSKDFDIKRREISYNSLIELQDIFKHEYDCIETQLYIPIRGKKAKAQIFMLKEVHVFLSEDYTKYINTLNYKCSGSSNTSPIIFESEYVDCCILPISFANFMYSIRKLD
jgi:hypothetical protein